MAKGKGGKNRSNCPSSTDPVRDGDAWARKFSNWDKIGGSDGDSLQPGKTQIGGVTKGLPTSVDSD
jgi:hypothetical protein